jgi:exoribonuclease R
MNKQYGRADLARIAAKDMADRGLTAEFSTSIDNETSRDLDQLTVCERLPNGALKVMVAIADVERGFIDFEEVK